MSLSEYELNIIKTIAIYCVMDEMEKKKIIEKEHFLSHYNGLNDLQKVIVSNFEIFKSEMYQDLLKIRNKNNWGIHLTQPISD